MRQLSYTIEPEADGLSVNAYARNIAGLSRAFLRSVKFRENGILINGQRVTTRGVLHAGDSLVFNMPNDRTQKVMPAEGPSFGVAPSGTCTWMSIFLWKSSARPSSSEWART